MKVVYIAGPFRGANSWDMENNIRDAEALALEVWKLGAACVCPHTNTRFFHDAQPIEVWLKGDLEILRRCDALLMTETWERSTGASAERDEAIRLHIPIFYTLDILREFLERASFEEALTQAATAHRANGLAEQEYFRNSPGC